VEIWCYLATALAAYLLGSVPTGFLVAQAKGIDIRHAGSGNIGATNAMRVLGKPAGIFVLLTDGLKGFLACNLIVHLVFELLGRPAGLSPALKESLAIVGGLSAIAGHIFTCWLKFKGGKGIATSCGAYLGLVPLAALLALVAWTIAFLLTRYVSIASIVSAVVLPTAVGLTQSNAVLTALTIALGALAIFKHKANIQRLFQGTESRISFKKKEAVS